MTHPSLRLANKQLWILLIVGWSLGLALLLGAGNVAIKYDEAAYVKHAQQLNETGTYEGIWPPGYPAIISLFLRIFGTHGLDAFRFFQVFCSVATGWAVMQLSTLWFGVRGALVSGMTWAIYLPLAFFTHHLWPETLFLALFVPAIYLMVSHLEKEDTRGRNPLVPAAVGILFGLSLYLKESPTYLALPLTVMLIVSRPPRLLHAAAFVLSMVAVILPWTLRNYAHYERFVLMGVTLDSNIQHGLNGPYKNHDYNNDRNLVERVHRSKDNNWDWIYRHFMDYGEGWTPSQAQNVVDQTKADLFSAVRYAMDHKKAFVQTRIKKMADFATPLSFAVRDLRPKVYSGPLGTAPVRRPLICIALVCDVLLLPASWICLVRIRHRRNVLKIVLVVAGYFILSSLLVSMSRYRLLIVPFLLILLGASTTGKKETQDKTLIWILVGLSILAFLWLLNCAEVCEVVISSWG